MAEFESESHRPTDAFESARPRFERRQPRTVYFREDGQNSPNHPKQGIIELLKIYLLHTSFESVTAISSRLCSIMLDRMGTYANPYRSITQSGWRGARIVELERDEEYDIVSARFRKHVDGDPTRELTVRIIIGDEVVFEESTTEEFGMVSEIGEVV